MRIKNTVRFKKFGPLTYFRVNNLREKNFLDVSLTKYRNAPWGWVWGSDGCEEYAPLNLEILGLRVFSWSKSVIYILGFWWSR